MSIYYHNPALSRKQNHTASLKHYPRPPSVPSSATNNPLPIPARAQRGGECRAGCGRPDRSAPSPGHGRSRPRPRSTTYRRKASREPYLRTVHHRPVHRHPRPHPDHETRNRDYATQHEQDRPLQPGMRNPFRSVIRLFSPPPSPPPQPRRHLRHQHHQPCPRKRHREHHDERRARDPSNPRKTAPTPEERHQRTNRRGGMIRIGEAKREPGDITDKELHTTPRLTFLSSPYTIFVPIFTPLYTAEQYYPYHKHRCPYTRHAVQHQQQNQPATGKVKVMQSPDRDSNTS